MVICAYTMARWADMVAAVDSVRKQQPPPAQIVLVVDHNDDLFIRARADLGGVTIVKNTGPQGLSGARNTGVLHATGDIVAFLDDDAAAQVDWLAALVRPYEDPDVIGTGGDVVAAWDQGKPSWFPDEFGWVVGCSYRGQPESMIQIRNPLGCSMSFRRSLFEQIGGFRPEVGRIGTRPVGCEETEFCIRAAGRDPGSRIIDVPASKVHHRVPTTRARPGYFLARCFEEGRSKAIVASIAGAAPGLSVERRYALRTLPRGVVANLSSLVRGDVAGVTRATFIVAGLAWTTLGYVMGRVAIRTGRWSTLGTDAVQAIPIRDRAA